MSVSSDKLDKFLLCLDTVTEMVGTESCVQLVQMFCLLLEIFPGHPAIWSGEEKSEPVVSPQKFGAGEVNHIMLQI